MQGINCVKGEIHSVLTALRLTSKSRRSAYLAAYSEVEEPLIKSLKDLHEELSTATDLALIDTCVVTIPFLEAIAAEGTDQHVTLTALESVHKFLVYGLINRKSPNVAQALWDTVFVLTRLPVEVGDSELVAMKTLDVLVECLRSPAGPQLSDDAVCAIMEECMRIRASTSSRLLRGFAEGIATQLVLVAFARLSSFAPAGAVDADDHDDAWPGRAPRPAAAASAAEEAAPAQATPPSEAGPSPSPEPPSPSTVARGRPLLSPSWQRRPQLSPPMILEPLVRLPPSTRARKRRSTLMRRRRRSESLGLSETKDNDDLDVDESAPKIVPYGVGALTRILRFLALSIAPKNDMETRVLGLRLVRVVLETAGRWLNHFPPLVQIVQNDLCKHILQSALAQDLTVLSLTLRIVFDLFNFAKKHLKVQLEVFLKSIHLRLGESDSAAPEQRQLVLESLAEFCRESSLIVGVYRNYDCEVGSSDLFHEVCRFLAKTATPPPGKPISNLNVLALDGVLAVLDSIAKRFCDPNGPAGSEESEASPVGEPGNPEEEASLMQMRERKRQLAAAAEHFNREGKKSFKLLQDLGVLPDPLTPESVVRFLRETPNLDKTNVGAFLGGEKELNQQVLAAFVNSFDFSKLPTCSPPALAAPPAPAPAAPPAQAHTAEGEAAAAPEGAPHAAAPAAEPANAPPSSQPAESAIVAAPFVTIDAAMRFLLETFRLPGEAQQIARIMQAFAARFFEQCPGPLADKDAAFVLAYSVIMLHTDAHSKKIRRKMTKEEFVRNNRGINAGRDLPRWYVEALYDSVVQNEIRLTDSEIEADDGINEKGWSNVVSRSRASGHFKTHAPRVHGKDMFLLVWESAVQIFHSYLLQRNLDAAGEEGDEAAESEEAQSGEAKIVQKIIEGIYTFSRICAVYELHNIFNSLLAALARSLGHVLDACLHDAAASGSSPAALFGRNKRAHKMAALLFHMVIGYGEAHVLEAWGGVVATLRSLHRVGVLPPALIERADFVDAAGNALPSLRPAHRAQTPASARGFGGLISSALSFLWSSAPEEGEAAAAAAAAAASGGAAGAASAAAAPAGGFRSIEQQYEEEGRRAVAACLLPELFASTNYFRPQPLAHLLRALLDVAMAPPLAAPASASGEGGETPRDQEAEVDIEDRVLCLERVFDVLVRNHARMDDAALGLWAFLQGLVEAALAAAPPAPSYFMERLIVNLLRFSFRLPATPSSTAQLLRVFGALHRLTPAYWQHFGERIAAGLALFVKERGEYLADAEAWRATLALLSGLAQWPRCAPAAFETVEYAAENLGSVANTPLLLDAAVAFASVGAHAPSAPARKDNVWNAIAPSRVVALVLSLHTRIDAMVATVAARRAAAGAEAKQAHMPSATVIQERVERDRQRGVLWLGTLQTLCRLARDQRPDMRARALEGLQRALLASNVEMRSPSAWRTCFDVLLLPLLLDAAFDAPARLRAATVLFQTLLHNMNTLVALPDFHLFWLKLLAALEPCLRADTESVAQHFAEHLKNTLLVMETSGIFRVASGRAGLDVLAASWRTLEPFAPRIREEVLAQLQPAQQPPAPPRLPGAPALAR